MRFFKSDSNLPSSFRASFENARNVQLQQLPKRSGHGLAQKATGEQKWPRWQLKNKNGNVQAGGLCRQRSDTTRKCRWECCRQGMRNIRLKIFLPKPQTDPM